MNPYLLKNIFFLLILFFLTGIQAQRAQESQPLNFSLLFQGGVGSCSGFLGNGNPAPEGGLWLGINLSDRFDGLWGMDYFTLPNMPLTINQTPNANNGFQPFFNVQPTDDVSLTVNTRWYWSDKYDYVHGRFNSVPYLLSGFGMDLVVDQPPPPTNPAGPPPPFVPFYNKSFDILLSLNLGAGMDFPFDKQWMFYAEGLDHLIIWQGITQILVVRGGIKLMVDSAHIDPFRGLF